MCGNAGFFVIFRYSFLWHETLREGQGNIPRFHCCIQQLERRYLNNTQSGGDAVAEIRYQTPGSYGEIDNE